jgi:molybdenum cofactor cytidylyltransferase
MGTNKLFLRLGGETLLRRAVKLALEAGLDPVLVVIGHEAEKAGREVEGLECRTVLNPDHESGPGTSLRAGIRAVPPGCRAAVVLLADMPLVTAAMIGALVERHRATGAPLVVSDYGGTLAPPTLYGRSLFDEIEAVGPETGGKEIVARHSDRAVRVAAPAATLSDLDVPDDLARIRAALERGGA